jgi:hypothetical protein
MPVWRPLLYRLLLPIPRLNSSSILPMSSLAASTVPSSKFLGAYATLENTLFSKSTTTLRKDSFHYYTVHLSSYGKLNDYSSDNSSKKCCTDELHNVFCTHCVFDATAWQYHQYVAPDGPSVPFISVQESDMLPTPSFPGLCICAKRPTSAGADDACPVCVRVVVCVCDGCDHEAETLAILWTHGYFRLCEGCLDALIDGLAFHQLTTRRQYNAGP